MTLLTSARRLVAMNIMHRFSMKFCAVLSGTLAAGREGSVIAMPVIKVMIYVAVKMFWPVKPWSGADKNAARKPLRSVVTVWRAVIGRSLVIAIRTYRGLSDADCNLCIRCSRRTEKTARRYCH